MQDHSFKSIATLVVLETSDVGTRYTAEAVRRLGFEVLFLVTPSSYQADTREQLAHYPCLECVTTDVDAVVAALTAYGVGRIAGLTTLLDGRLETAALAAQRLNVPGLDRGVLRLKDKAVVADLVPEWSPPTVGFREREVPAEKIAAILRMHGRAVLKPTKAAGGIGNFTISSDDLDRIPSLIARGRPSPDVDDGRWIVQAHLDGPLVSAEGFVHDGCVTVLGFSGRQKIGLTESRIDFPTDRNMTSDQVEACTTAVRSLFARARFTDGYFHVEFILTARQPYVIDANVGRPGGGSVAEQIAASFGIDPVEVFEHVVRTTLFPRAPTTARSPYGSVRRPTLGILYGLAERGNFEGVDRPTPSRCHHTQILDGGQTVPEMGLNNWSWIGILSGPEADVEREIRTLRIRAGGASHRPSY